MIYLSIISTSVIMLFIWCISKEPEIKKPIGYAILAFWYIVLVIQIISTFSFYFN
jgi:hypothetical protein